MDAEAYERMLSNKKVDKLLYSFKDEPHTAIDDVLMGVFWFVVMPPLVFTFVVLGTAGPLSVAIAGSAAWIACASFSTAAYFGAMGAYKRKIHSPNSIFQEDQRQATETFAELPPGDQERVRAAYLDFMAADGVENARIFESRQETWIKTLELIREKHILDAEIDAEQHTIQAREDLRILEDEIKRGNRQVRELRGS